MSRTLHGVSRSSERGVDGGVHGQVAWQMTLRSRLDLRRSRGLNCVVHHGPLSVLGGGRWNEGLKAPASKIDK